jgi:ribonuclease HI
MTVTINTDASFSAHQNRGTYAFWIRSNEGKISRSGILRGYCKRAEVAEFKCIINALHSLIHSEWKDIERIVINTDCLNVIHLLNDHRKAIRRYRLRSWGEPLVKKFKEIKGESRLSRNAIDIRHVKAHVSTESPRQWVNDWCDTNAKMQMNKLLIKLDKK